MNLLKKFNTQQVEKLKKDEKHLVDFAVGDTVKVEYKITEGGNTRIQSYEGVVIAKSKQPNHLHASFVVRKISSGIGVERKFPFHSPLIHKIVLVRKGETKRGKLYYLRNLSGKSARIKEKIDFNKKNGAKTEKKSSKVKEEGKSKVAKESKETKKTEAKKTEKEEA